MARNSFSIEQYRQLADGRLRDGVRDEATKAIAALIAAFCRRRPFRLGPAAYEAKRNAVGLVGMVSPDLRADADALLTFYMSAPTNPRIRKEVERRLSALCEKLLSRAPQNAARAAAKAELTPFCDGPWKGELIRAKRVRELLSTKREDALQREIRQARPDEPFYVLRRGGPARVGTRYKEDAVSYVSKLIEGAPEVAVAKARQRLRQAKRDHPEHIADNGLENAGLRRLGNELLKGQSL